MVLKERYIQLIKHHCTDPGDSTENLGFWHNKLFFILILYILPLSLISMLPALYWIYKIQHYLLGLVDILMVASVLIVAFVPGISLIVRKIIFISCVYAFSSAMLYYGGMNGPGLTYLLASCIFSILIFSTVHLYWPAWLNTFISAAFFIIIALDLMPEKHLSSHNPGEWIAVSGNLIFLSFLCVALIPRIFRGLQETIDRQTTLQRQLEIEKGALNDTTIALRHALYDLNSIMNSSLDVICTMDEEGRFVRVSAACEAVWGYTAGELIGKQSFDFVYPEDLSVTIDAAKQELIGTNVVNFENRFVHKNGSLIPVSWSSRWDEKDQLRYSVARDLRDRKKLENAVLLERENLYALFLEAPVSMGVLGGPDYVFQVANPLYYQIIGKSDIIGKPLREVLPPVVDQGIIEILDAVYTTGETFTGNEMLIQLEFENRLIDKYFNLSYQAHKRAGNNIDSIFFFANDVTEQVISRKKVESSEAFSRGVLNSLSSKIAVIDSSGNIIATNESWSQFGLENDNPLVKGATNGSNYLQACVEAMQGGVEYAAKAYSGIMNVLDETSEHYYLEYPFDSLEEDRWFGMRVTRFEGSQPFAVISHQDITERKAAEFERLGLVNNMLERNKDLEQFAYIVSHNLRAPVANILGLISILGSDTLTKTEVEETNSALYHSVNKLDEVVKDLNQILQLKA